MLSENKKQRPLSAREAAARALFDIEEKGAWSAPEIRKYSAALSKKDAALMTELVGGVLQNSSMCDFYLSHYSKIRLKKLDGRIRTIMRIGVYQIVWLDKIPHSAAVNESVSMAKSLCHANAKTAGYVNGVLRAVSRDIDNLPVPSCATKAEFYSLFYSNPMWLTERFIKQFGEKQTRLLLQANNAASPVVLRVNTLKATAEDVFSELENSGINVKMHESIPNCMTVSGTGDLQRLPSFVSGRVTVQDGASQMSVYALSPTPDSVVIDCCAAPGGKSFFISERMKNTGELISCDIYEHKLDKIREGAERLGCTNLSVRLQDASEFRCEWENYADFVLCDVPCSGFGIIRKKPEIRYKSEEEIKELPKIQMKILENCCRYVKDGGVLVYSTCTILDEENRQIVEKFLENHSEFCLEAFELPVCGKCSDGTAVLLPYLYDTDGFFVAKFRKKR